jgi:hypothetical protein
MIRVRFHLGAGAHFMHWQVRHHDGSVTYHDPAFCTLTIFQGRLRNQAGTASKIHCGAAKSVCAWIEAEHVVIDHGTAAVFGAVEVAYNPRVAPHWRMNGLNADGRRFEVMTTSGNRVFVAASNVAVG